MTDSFSCIPLDLQRLIFNIGADIYESHSYTLMSAILKVNSICDITMTSTPNVFTTKLRDLYNQCTVILFSFDLGLRLFHYFTHFEPSQLLDGAKGEKPSDHPQAELGSSQTRARLEPTAVRSSDLEQP